METIIAAVASALVSALAAIAVSAIQHQKTVALVAYRLEQLEKKVDKHNQVVERVYRLEQEASRQMDELERHKERLRILEDGMK